ncbi:MAG: DNA-binding response regulator [Alphaproteobacteria bacterium]|nr:MAG: DNA-binding response regulator [Alphaproteobacteria bacterium]TAF38366.1 MAG: DNA-binding response regulator [Alphaproteobacteria bacterium]TAF77137.1 MAG: DNA-binding response regulator [Alphaproteobacteria bacterium]
MHSPPPLLHHILVVDDDARLRSLLARYLGEHGWLITCARDAEDARAKMAYFTFDLMVLDVMMPKETGVEFTKSLRSQGSTIPIVMLTAMSEGHERVQGLEVGADDYLTKPFEPKELVLRIHNLIQRVARTKPRDPHIQFGAFRLNMTHKRLTLHEQAVHLTESEMHLLIILAQSLNQTVSRESLCDALTPQGEDPNPRSIDVLITRLRKKIEVDPSRPTIIHTVRGEGYALRG